ncbi:MAG: type II toxin-antitoxin system VapC family toxin [bacterium]|nr:type II toxin-antitoxin system VapC family toxin [bacterium]
MVILDTNIIIDYLRRKKSASILEKLVQRYPAKDLAISVISIQELYEGQSTKDKSKEQLMIATLAPLQILSYTYEIAQLAGKIARDLPRPIELADAAIAATAIMNNDSLLTLNLKDYNHIPNLILFDISRL